MTSERKAVCFFLLRLQWFEAMFKILGEYFDYLGYILKCVWSIEQKLSKIQEVCPAFHCCLLNFYSFAINQFSFNFWKNRIYFICNYPLLYYYHLKNNEFWNSVIFTEAVFILTEDIVPYLNTTYCGWLFHYSGILFVQCFVWIFEEKLNINTLLTSQLLQIVF